MKSLLLPAAIVCVLVCAGSAGATTYEVGPGRPYAHLEAIDDVLGPGDVVLLDGDHTYSGGVWLQEDGAPGAPITIRGAGASRPVLSGGSNTIELQGDHTVLENVELTGGSARCLYLHADGLVVRDTLVHHCPAQGILGADQDSGDATLERVEVHHAGGGTGNHSIYMATDEVTHPGSVFRMRDCWVHDATGGNLVKSRAERNEITYNRLEGNSQSFHELELIGPDPGGGRVAPGVREDSDIVGNVLIHARADFTYATRVGGDATGESEGRYRFVANTFIGPAAADRYRVFRAFDALESIEAHGNVMHRPGGVEVLADYADWTLGAARVAGTHNWVTEGSDVPGGFGSTLTGAEPGFAALAAGDLRPLPDSPLVDAGAVAPTPSGFNPFPSPTFPPGSHPPLALMAAPGAARPVDEALDIGAYELPDPSYRPPSAGGRGGAAPGGGSRALRRALARARVTVRKRAVILTLTISEAATVRGRLLRGTRARRASALRWRQIRPLRARRLSAGTHRLRLRRPRAGRYRLRLSARNADGTATATVQFRVRR